MWETRDQVDARYGKALRAEPDGDFTVYTYAFLDFQILVTYLDGKSQSELYYHPDNRQLSSRDRDLILSLNASSGSWRTFEEVLVLIQPSGGHPIAVGRYEPDAHPPILGVCTAEFEKKKSASVLKK